MVLDGPRLPVFGVTTTFSVISWRCGCYRRIPIVSFAFWESLCIYGLVIALAILFANTNACICGMCVLTSLLATRR